MKEGHLTKGIVASIISVGIIIAVIVAFLLFYH